MQTLPRLSHRISACILTAALLSASPAHAAPFQFLTVGDPLESEIRLLELFPRSELRDRLRLPHLGTRPLRLAELQGNGAPVEDATPEVALSVARIERVLGRDPAPGFTVSEANLPTPRLFQRAAAGGQVLEASLGLEGTLLTRKADLGSAAVSGSGLHARLAVGSDRFLAYTHQVLGRFADGQRIADPIVTNTDIIVLTEETYLAFCSRSGNSGVSFGRGRWHWGPGEEGSLLLSRTSAPFTALMAQTELEAFHLNGTVINSTLRQAAGEQLSAHRVEWQPVDGLRVGASEAVRYRAAGWQWEYAIGIFPFAVAQRILAQDEPDSTNALHNNILTGFDVAWRVAPGARLYGEVLVDDLHAESSANPNKFAWQVGYEGARSVGRQRLSWGVEMSRVWRYVYTSYFGRVYEAQGRTLGFPTGPDARRIRLRFAWDPSVDWQATLRVGLTDQGENSILEPYLPGTPAPQPGTFEGTVERAHEVELGMRWWPAGGVDLQARGEYRWFDNDRHVPGARTQEWTGALQLRLVR